MKTIFKKYLLTSISVFILTEIVPAVSLNGDWGGFFYATFILSLLLYIAKPMANIIMLPLNILTFNLIKWITQMIFFYLWTIIVSEVQITSWQIMGANLGVFSFASLNLVSWQVIIVSSILLTLIIRFLEWIF